MLDQVVKEVNNAIDKAYGIMSQQYYIPFVLYIARADIVPGLSRYAKTDCVIDFQLDRYFDETREQFYLRYLNRNYRKNGFKYDGESGIDDLSIEMMIYSHIWESHYFLKSLRRIAGILANEGYLWDVDIKPIGKWDYIKKYIITPLKSSCPELASIVEMAYSSDIRNAFAHSLYVIDSKSREIHIRPKRNSSIIPFEEFQKKFLYSAILMNHMQNALEINHIAAARKNTALTETFQTPDGVSVQVKACTKIINGTEFPKYYLDRVIPAASIDEDRIQ